jgi:hypothetical protein
MTAEAYRLVGPAIGVVIGLALCLDLWLTELRHQHHKPVE